jgi:hypothetical protein
VKCKTCGYGDFKINAVFQGTVSIIWKDDEDDFEVYDSEPTDSEWDDESGCYCVNCGWTGKVADVKVAA